MTRRYWTSLELEFLRQVYAEHTTEAIAVVLGRTIGQVYAKARDLDLKKSEAYIATAGRIQQGARMSPATEFKPGHVPANKGLRRPGWAPGRMAETQFKKGGMTGAARHNYVPIGSLRVTRDDILERKVTDDPNLYPARRWVPVTRLVWEAAHGPIPPRHMVVFKPGMHTTAEAEITVDRLECITLADNMRRNTLHNYPKEIAHAIQLRGALNRRINNVKKHQRSA